MASRGTSHREETPGRESHRSCRDIPVRNPDVYSLTDHFRRRLRQSGRYVTLTDVDEAIQYGQLRWNSCDGWRFSIVRDGIRCVVAVADTETHSPVMVTGWTTVECRRTALKSDRWSVTEVDTIQLRAGLSEDADERVPMRIRPRHVQRPFAVGNHRITTAAGVASVTCADCGRQFRSKTGLRMRRCEPRNA